MNRKLLRSVREYKRQTIQTPILVALEVLMEVLIPLLMAKIRADCGDRISGICEESSP